MATLTARRQFADLFKNVITFTGTHDVANLADGAGTTDTFTVPGAAIGDQVLVSMGVSLAGITTTAYVSAANTVAVRFQNESGGAVNLAAAPIYLTVLQRNEQVYL